jgi:hypothetical protein
MGNKERDWAMVRKFTGDFGMIGVNQGSRAKVGSMTSMYSTREPSLALEPAVMSMYP